MPTCAHCGETFPKGKLVCPECGADADLTWSPDIAPEEFGVEDPRFDDAGYDEFLRREGLGDASTPSPKNPKKSLGCGVFALLLLPGVAAWVLL